MRIRKHFLVVFFTFLTAAVYCQESDFGIWYEINGDYKLSGKFDINLSTALRTFNGASDIEQGLIQTGISYEAAKWLSFSGAYRISKNIDDSDLYHLRHKWIVDSKIGGDISRINFSGRLRFQRQDKTFFEDQNDRVPDYYLRLRFKTVYKTPSFPVNPCFSIETFSRVFESTTKNIDKYRYLIGCEYQINKKSSFEASYVFEHDLLPRISDINVIVLTYNFKLKNNK